MALEIPLIQSKPLLKPVKSASPVARTVISSATSILSGHLDGQPKKFSSGYLVHPGAILCIMGLLLTVDYNKVIGQRVIEAPSSDTPSTMRKKLESDFPYVVATVIDLIVRIILMPIQRKSIQRLEDKLDHVHLVL